MIKLEFIIDNANASRTLVLRYSLKHQSELEDLCKDLGLKVIKKISLIDEGIEIIHIAQQELELIKIFKLYATYRKFNKDEM